VAYEIEESKKGGGIPKAGGGFQIQRSESIRIPTRLLQSPVWNSDKSLTRNTKLSKNPLVLLALPYSLSLLLYGFHRSRHQRTIFKASTPRNNLVSSEGRWLARVASIGRLK